MIPTPDKTARLRTKSQKLCQCEKKLIRPMATIDEVKFKDLMELYRISESTLKRIVSMRKLVTANSGCEHYVTCSKQLEFKEMAAYIQEKVKSELTPMTAADIKSCIEDEWEIRVSTNCVRRFMKNNANLSYKKCSTRLINYNNEKARLLKLLFVVELWKILPEIEAIFNIDEFSFSQLTKENYHYRFSVLINLVEII